MKYNYNSALATVLGGSLFSAIIALSAPRAEAQCQQYDVSGQWTIQQGSFYIPVALTQNGSTISGTAFHQSRKDSDQSHVSVEIRNVHGQVVGTVEGDRFNVQINWSGGGAGVYSGKISQSGNLFGTTYDKNKPSSTAKWSCSHKFECARAAAVPPANPTPPLVVKPVKSSGKPKPAATPPSTPTPAPPPVLSTQGEAEKQTRPYIRALPQIVRIPRDGSDAFTKLVWYAGNDHPDAQLVVAVNGGEERLVDSQRKGSRQVPVKQGRKYVYTLSEGGQPLASVVVQADQPSTPTDPRRLRGLQREGRQRGQNENQTQEDE